MADSYGANTYFTTVRAAIATELNALKAAITSGSHSPTIDTVYTTHLGTANWSFNAVSIGIAEIPMEEIGGSSTGAGALIQYRFAVDLRVMIGYINTYPDEEKVLKLCQSIVNWFEENRTLGAQFKYVGTQTVRTREVFEDTETIGGLVELTVIENQGYTAA